MASITVFLDKTGRPIGTCPVGHESEWLKGLGGENFTSQLVARQVSSTDEEWEAWAVRNAQTPDDGAGLCIRWVTT